MVIVQPTPYGADNRCTLEAARSLRGRARAVAVVGEGINEQDLRWMHSIGVRGLRINLETAGIADPGWQDRTSVDKGMHVQVSVAIGCHRTIKKQKNEI